MGRGNARRIAAAVVGASLVLAACSPSADGESRQACTWTIGLMGAFEGEVAKFGTPPARGAEIAVDLANESGELACTLETHSESTGEDLKEAPASAERLVEDDDVIACVCGFFNGETAATGGVFEQAGIAMLSSAEESTMRERGFETWFRLVAPVDWQATATGLYIRRVYEPRRAAIVTTLQSYSDDVVDHVSAALGRRVQGPPIPLNPEGTGPYTVARKVRRMSADLVFFAGYAPEAWEVLVAMRRDYDLKIPFVAPGGVIGGPQGPDKIGRFRFSCGCSDVTKLGGTEAFVAEYRERHRTKPPLYAAEGFDGANAVIEALRELDGTESPAEVRAHVVDYLDRTDGIDGLVKRYAWDDRGELVTDDGDVWMWEWSAGRGFRMLGSVAQLTE